MLSSLTLSKKELIYASMITGIDNIWGIADPYSEMSEDVIRIDILRIQKSLIEKRYAITEDEGPFTLFDGVIDTLRLCAEARYMYEFSSEELERCNHVLRFFCCGDVVIRLDVKEDVTLSVVQLSEMKDELSTYFCSEDGDIWSGALTAGTTRLKRYGSVSRNRFICELKEKGCNDILSVIIANGLQGSSSFRVVVCYDISSPDTSIPVEKLVTIHFPGGDLIAKANDGSLSESITLCKLSQEQISAEIDRITIRVLGNGGDQYAS